MSLLAILPVSAAAAPKKKKLLYDNLPTAPTTSFAPVSKWGHLDLTYGFVNGTPDISGNDEHQAVREAMALWSAKSPLSFTETSAAVADIEVSWGSGDHGDGFPFDGIGGDLAHAFYAPDGRVHFDDAEIWTMSTRASTGQPIDLVTVAAHEIGHAIGLGHSEDPSALMYPAYTISHRYLDEDDFNGVTTLYPNQWRLRDTNSAGNADLEFQFGVSGTTIVNGDWDGDGTETSGTYNTATGVWNLRNSNSSGGAEITFQYGGGPWTRPVVGDWDGNGTMTIGVYDPVAGNWNLRNSLGGGAPNYSFQYGGGVWSRGIVGDWNGDGVTSIGVYNPTAGNWNLRNSNSGGNPNYSFQYGGGVWNRGISGDWDGDGDTTIGVVRE